MPIASAPCGWTFQSYLEHIRGNCTMNGIIYLVGLIVVVMAILSFVGLR